MGKVLKDAFLDELKDAYDGEKQLTRALPKLAKSATDAELQLAFQSHLEETLNHVAMLEQVFELLDEKAKGKHCDGLAGIIEEGKSIMEEDFEPATMDACLIAAGQRSEHYEIAAYGTLVAWSEGLGNKQVTKILNEILAEEKMADQKLSQLAEAGINLEAVNEQQADDSARSDRANGGNGTKGGSGGNGGNGAKGSTGAKKVASSLKAPGESRAASSKSRGASTGALSSR